MARKGGTPENLKPFKKGFDERRNLAGPPKIIDLSELLYEEGGEEGFRKATRALFAQAAKGNIKAIQEIYDRYYGKVMQKTETDLTTGGKPFNLKDLIGFKD